MDKLKSLIKYHKSIYIKSNQFVIPFVILIMFLCISYSMIPVFIVSSFSITFAIVFYLMIWISFKYADSDDLVASQVIILKISSDFLYNISRILF